ncbi:Asp23/Gls24 family envelope stress response protein [Nocardioides marmoraquaticus]
MITRTVLAVDRLATLLLSLALLAGGAAAIWWWTGTSGLPRTLSTGPVTDVTDAAWFPAAAAATGLVLALLGLRWLTAHVRRTTVPSLHLRGSGRQGRLQVDTSRVAAAAAAAYADTLGVRSARGRVVRDRGQLVVRISATIDRDADLALLAEQADRVATELAGVLERPELRCSVELKVAGVTSALAR